MLGGKGEAVLAEDESQFALQFAERVRGKLAALGIGRARQCGPESSAQATEVIGLNARFAQYRTLRRKSRGIRALGTSN